MLTGKCLADSLSAIAAGVESVHSTESTDSVFAHGCSFVGHWILLVFQSKHINLEGSIEFKHSCLVCKSSLVPRASCFEHGPKNHFLVLRVIRAGTLLWDTQATKA